ncbi:MULTISPECIES: OmpA family protein [Persicobacter]|nr:OmpA family protein [Persicobacter sp. CCB-QB2]
MGTIFTTKRGLTFALALFALSGCVSQKKYDEILARRDILAEENASANEALELVQDENDRLKDRLNKNDQLIESLNDQAAKERLEAEKLQAKYKNVDFLYNDMVRNSGRLNQSVADQQRRLSEMTADLEVSRRNNEALEQDLQIREARVKELEKVVKQREEAVNSLKQKLDNALTDFEVNDLQVETRQGKIYVSVADKLLFGSGSVEVDELGIKALQKLAVVVKSQEDFEVSVEGHTDNVPVSRFSKYMNDNWDLSVARATSIVRILLEAGVSPGSIQAVGKGEHYPVTENNTKEGRSLNRRIEIILIPKVTEDYISNILEG